jgi:DNA processing protein
VTVSRDQQERVALVALTLLHGGKELGLTTAHLRARFDRGERPSTVLAGTGGQEDPGEALFALPADASNASAEQLRVRLLAQAIEQIAAWERAGHQFVAFFEDDYPRQLATAFDNPLLVFYAGALADDFASVAIVGSRDPSPQGLQFARELSGITARAGITVVSGLARGVDRAAHEAALDADGRTVAVIGTGLDRFYPPEHEPLQRRIATDGLVVSQFPPGATPSRATFPMRNATMSAYSALTVIVEAGEKSGTKIQAAAAVKHGRPLVLTRQVVTATTWGRRYLDDGYDVTVAATPGEALEAVQKVLSRSSRVLQWVGGIAGTE